MAEIHNEFYEPNDDKPARATVGQPESDHEPPMVFASYNETNGTSEEYGAAIAAGLEEGEGEAGNELSSQGLPAEDMRIIEYTAGPSGEAGDQSAGDDAEPPQPADVPAPAQDGGGNDEPPEPPAAATGGYGEDDRGDDEAQQSDQPEASTEDPAEATSEIPRPQNRNVVVERRQVGDVSVVAVLHGNKPEDTGDIAHAMRGCDVLVFDAHGIVDGEMRALEAEKLNRIVATSTDPQRVRRLHQRALEQGNVPAATLCEMTPADQKVVLVGMDRDHPDLPGLTQDREESLEKYTFDIAFLKPLGETQRSGLQYAQAEANREEAMERVVSEQVERIVASAEPGTVIGLGLFGSCHRTVEALGEKAGDEDAASVEKRAKAGDIYSYIHLAVDALRSGDIAQAEDFVNKNILSSYLSFGMTGGDVDIPGQVMEHLSREQIREAMGRLETTLGDQSTPYEMRYDDVRQALLPVFGDMLTSMVQFEASEDVQANAGGEDDEWRPLAGGSSADDQNGGETPAASGGGGGGDDRIPPPGSSAEGGDEADDDHETSPEARPSHETSPNPSVIVEHKTVNGVPVTAVLAPMRNELVGDIAAQLTDCDVVVFGGTYYRDDETRRGLEADITSLMASGVSPSVIADAAHGHPPEQLAAALHGTDKRAVIVGMSNSDSGHPALLRAQQAYDEYDKAIEELVTPGLARVAGRGYVEAKAGTEGIMAGRTAEQLSVIIGLAQLEGDSVGLVLDQELYDVVGGMTGDAPEGEASEPLASKVAQHAPIISKATQAYREGDRPRAFQLADQHLICQYVASIGLGVESGASITYGQIEQVVGEYGAAWASERLDDLSNLLASAETTEVRRDTLATFLRPVADEVLRRMWDTGEPGAGRPEP